MEFKNIDEETIALDCKASKIFNNCANEGLLPYQVITISVELIYLTLKNSGYDVDSAIMIADAVNNFIGTEIEKLNKGES